MINFKRNPIQSNLILAVLLSFFTFQPDLNAQDKLPESSFKRLGENRFMLNEVEINTAKRSITIPCAVNMKDGLIEVVLCRPEGKTHESFLVTNTTPLEFNTAMLLLGLDPVNEIPDDPSKKDPLSNFNTIETSGDSVLIFLEGEFNGQHQKKPLEYFIFDKRKNKVLKPSTWLYRGAVTFYTGHLIIDNEVTMIATYHDPVCLMELNEKGKFDDELFYVNEAAGLIENQKVKLVIQAIIK
jgi:hypothetical protein